LAVVNVFFVCLSFRTPGGVAICSFVGERVGGIILVEVMFIAGDVVARWTRRWSCTCGSIHIVLPLWLTLELVGSCCQFCFGTGFSRLYLSSSCFNLKSGRASS
jgi:hypothetical protein